MKLLRLIPNNTNFDFLRIKVIAFIFSLIVLSSTFISLIVNNLNYGIDFKGGILLELRSKNLNSSDINDIREFEDPPKCWEYSANKHGEINSNYGHLIFNDKYHNQYGQVLDELIRNPDSRRACMVYNRPSIWMEYNENGKNDFICTNSVTYYIRDNILHAVVQMRSNDVVFGYKNDYAWQFEIMNRLVKDWNDCKFEEYDTGNKISLGSMIWQVQNLHVYERHFELVK